MNPSDKEIITANTKSTHAVDILAFVEAQEISSVYFETPYYLAPVPGGEKVYALLRETLRRTRKIGIAYVVIHARQHLAALIPDGQSLVLNTLRWTSEDGSDDRPSLPVEDYDTEFLMEHNLALTASHGTFGFGAHQGAFQHAAQPAYQADAAALAEYEMKPKKIEEIVVEDLLDNLVDEDEMSDDDYLDAVLRPRLHMPDGYAMRRAGTTQRRSHNARPRARLRGTGR